MPGVDRLGRTDAEHHPTTAPVAGHRHRPPVGRDGRVGRHPGRLRRRVGGVEGHHDVRVVRGVHPLERPRTRHPDRPPLRPCRRAVHLQLPVAIQAAPPRRRRERRGVRPVESAGGGDVGARDQQRPHRQAVQRGGLRVGRSAANAGRRIEPGVAFRVLPLPHVAPRPVSSPPSGGGRPQRSPASSNPRTSRARSRVWSRSASRRIPPNWVLILWLPRRWSSLRARKSQ